MLQNFLSTLPLADESQVDAEIVISNRRHHLMIRVFVVTQGLLEIRDAFLGPLQGETDARHVRIDLAQEKGCRVVAYQLQRLLKFLQSRFVLAFIVIAKCDSKISLGQSAPVACLAINLERLARVFASNGILADRKSVV